MLGRVRTSLVAGAAVLLAVVAALLAAHVPDPPRGSRTTLYDTAGSGAGLPDTPPVHGGVAWYWLIVGAAVLALTAAALWWMLRDGLILRRWIERVEDTPAEEDQHPRGRAESTASAEDILATAAAALEAGGDAREVVVACWVELEDTAAAAGLGRRPAETTTAVARRWLGRTADPAAVDELAALYQLARYSRHPMTSAHRARARAALAGALATAAEPTTR